MLVPRWVTSSSSGIELQCSSGVLGIYNMIFADASPMGIEDSNSISGGDSVIEGGYNRIPGSGERLKDYGSKTFVVNLRS